VPEAVALGAVFAHEPRLGLLLAVFIGLQNLPESFNSYIDLRKRFSPNGCLMILLPLSFSGIVAALLGNLFLGDKPTLIASLMVFAAGGIVYLTFQDIAPMSKMKNRWGPALGGTCGFLVGMVGHAVIH
jgi:ZIP family zinc transporter